MPRTGLDQLTPGVSDLNQIRPENLVGPSKVRQEVKGRFMLCYWAARVLEYSMVDISKRLQISLPTVSISVQKGEKLSAIRVDPLEDI
jgi:hypothetical protein